MAYRHIHRPAGYGGSYYEAEKEVVRGPSDSYSSEYRVEEFGNGGYPMGRHHHHHNNGGAYVDKVTEVVSYDSNPGCYGRHHGGTEFVERKEEIIYESGCDPCRRPMY